jgi:hypothetical protein
LTALFLLQELQPSARLSPKVLIYNSKKRSFQELEILSAEFEDGAPGALDGFARVKSRV